MWAGQRTSLLGLEASIEPDNVLVSKPSVNVDLPHKLVLHIMLLMRRQGGGVVLHTRGGWLHWLALALPQSAP